MDSKKNYFDDKSNEENVDSFSKYQSTAESEFSSDDALPMDQDEVLIERHYTLSFLDSLGRRKLRVRGQRSGRTLVSGKDA